MLRVVELLGQAEAVSLGYCPCIGRNKPEIKPTLRKEGFMTRDSRMVERKKPGRRKAREDSSLASDRIIRTNRMAEKLTYQNYWMQCSLWSPYP
jgi:hypothetical protein